MQTIQSLLTHSNNYLKEKNIETYKIDSRVLLCYALDLSEVSLLTNPQKNVSRESEEKFKELIIRRGNHEPVKYIINKAWFMEYEFYVNENVLIPRFETELLVEKIITYVTQNGYKEILEIGAGSGCISISTAKACNDAKILAVDISENALCVAKINAEKNNVKNIDFMLSDLYTNIADKKFDVIVSNPPYIKTDVIDTLEKSVTHYEPILALDGGADGLHFYKKIIFESKKYLNENGMIFFEIGYDQGEAVKNILLSNGFVNVEVFKDYSDLDRIVIGKYGVN